MAATKTMNHQHRRAIPTFRSVWGCASDYANPKGHDGPVMAPSHLYGAAHLTMLTQKVTTDPIWHQAICMRLRI